MLGAPAPRAYLKPMSLLASLLAALLLLGCARGADAPSTAPGPAATCRSGEVERALQTRESTGVILILTDGGDPRARQARVLGELGPDFELVRQYESIPGMAGTITREGFARAQQHPDVLCVQFDGPGGGA